MSTRRYIPHLSGVAYASIFGFAYIVTKSALGNVQPFQLLGIRFLIAAAAYEILRLTKVIRIDLDFKSIKGLLPIAIFQPILYFSFETYGIKFSSAGESGLVIGLVPVIVAIFSYILLKEKLNKKQMIFMAVSILGIVLIGIMQITKASQLSEFKGYIFLVLALISAAVFNTLSRKASAKYSPFEITYVMIILGAIFFNTAGLIDANIHGYSYFAPLLNLNFVLSVLYLGILSLVIGFSLINYTLSKISATQSALYLNLSTVIAFIGGVLILDEALHYYKVIGSVLIVIGVWGTSYFGVKNNSKLNIENV